MKGKGNYWLETISKEKEFQREIESAIFEIIGKSFMDYESLHEYVMDYVRNHLEQYGLKNNMGEFKLDYSVDLYHDSVFELNGFLIRYVYLIDEFF